MIMTCSFLCCLTVVEATLGFIVKTLRDFKKSKATTGRHKRKKEEPEFVLIWDNDTVKKLVGGRADCVWYVLRCFIFGLFCTSNDCNLDV
jgi:hypothetical protein